MNILYRFPEAYVEGAKSAKHICLSSDGLVAIGDDIEKSKCIKIYGLVPFESVMEYIDLGSARPKVDIVVLIPRGNHTRAYIVDQNTSLCIQEIGGKVRYPLIEEGDFIKKGDRIVYSVTEKMEVRNVMSLCEGIILFIIDITWEIPGKTIVVTVREGAREVTIRENT